MSNIAQKNARSPEQLKYYLHCFITVGIMFGSWLIPVMAPLTPLGGRVLGIFVGVLYGWVMVGLTWPSIIALLALGLSGYDGMKSLFTQGFGHDITLFTFFILTAVAIVEQAGVSKYIANKIVKLKIATGRPWVIFVLFMIAGYWTAALVSVIGGVVICWNIFYNVCSEVGYTKQDKFPRLIVLAIMLGIVMGQSLFPFKIGPALFFGLYHEISGLTIDIGKAILLAFIYHVIILGAYFLVCRFILRPDVEVLKSFDVDSIESMTLNAYQKRVATFFAAMVVTLLLPTFLPKDFVLTEILGMLGTTGTLALFIAIAAAMRYEGKPFIDLPKCIYSGVSWDVIFLFACVFPLSSALTADSTGIKVLISGILEPILAGQSAFIFSMIILCFAMLVTNFCNNMVTGLLVMPIMFTFVAGIGANPAVITALLPTTICIAFLTPAAAPTAAMLYGNKAWLYSKDIVEFTVITTIIGILATAICIAIGEFIF